MANPQLCIGHSCARKATVENFCKFCDKKLKAGLLKINGELSTIAEAARKAQEAKEKSKIKKIKEKVIEGKKDYIKETLTMERLKQIQTLPMYSATFGCPYLQIQVCQANCLHRMFLADYPKKECRRCPFHNERLDTWIADIEGKEAEPIVEEVINFN